MLRFVHYLNQRELRWKTVLNTTEQGIKGRCFTPWPPGWRWRKLFWKLIWGSGPQEALVLFPKDRHVELCDSNHETFVLSQKKCEIWNFRSGCKMELPSSGQLQLFSASSLMGRESGWEAAEHSLQLTHSFPQSPIATSQERPAHMPVVQNTWKWNCILQTRAKKITAKYEDSSHSECKHILKQDKEQV